MGDPPHDPVNAVELRAPVRRRRLHAGVKRDAADCRQADDLVTEKF
jgi:hypothetical protein